jgi:hypothetical protein
MKWKLKYMLSQKPYNILNMPFLVCVSLAKNPITPKQSLLYRRSSYMEQICIIAMGTSINVST